MITTVDGSVYAQMSLPDMRVPIQNALTYPELVSYPFERLSFSTLELNLWEPESDRYPILGLARSAARAGGAYPLVFNAANEVAVDAFIGEQIRFTDIPTVISYCLERRWENLLGSFDTIEEYDEKARDIAHECIRAIHY
jgi:1-deoxy-D-xylulose-5-phosphate reductoisomerase